MVGKVLKCSLNLKEEIFCSYYKQNYEKIPYLENTPRYLSYLIYTSTINFHSTNTPLHLLLPAISNKISTYNEFQCSKFRTVQHVVMELLGLDNSRIKSIKRKSEITI